MESRRGFLKRTIGVAAAAAIAGPTRVVAQAMEQGGASARRNAPKVGARVVRVTSERILPVRVVQESLLKDAIREGLCRLTGETDVRDAWHRILKADDTILLKFNQSGALMLGTTTPFATLLIKSLTAAGWGPDRIVLLEAGSDSPVVGKTRKADMRWQGEIVDFGSSGKDSFIAALDQATAIINVPFLKTHHMATMTSSLKNLSHGLIRHPARFHATGCDPAIGQIVSSKQIRDKLKLNIVNALRIVVGQGAGVSEPDIHTAGTVLVGKDPVACDAVGYGILNEVRSLRRMPPLLAGARMPKQLGTAARLGLGVADLERIEVENV
jgi:hypothetical protein